ncbi:hypothetical protein [Sphingopyxis sp.]|uniref:hypothetical protein n=1 Tax=Sphingopyxis sp. TaxID=1908224 RepID=UPI002FC74911
MSEREKAKRPMSPRRKRYLTAIGLSGLIGIIMGAWSQVDNFDEHARFALLNNSPLTPSFAIGASILWIVGLIVCLFIYHRAVDDHEERAYLWAGLAAWYTFVLSAPTWWVLHRADLAPPVDTMLLFLGAMLVNCAVWLWLKYR